MIVLALDPGSEKTGWVFYDGARVLESGILPNADMLVRLNDSQAHKLAIEMVSSYGMPVGREVFETVWWAGRFTQAWHRPESVIRVYRQEVKLNLCRSARANDANIRQALIDRVGKPGTKKAPGPTYGVSGDMWAALGVAVVATERERVLRVAWQQNQQTLLSLGWGG